MKPASSTVTGATNRDRSVRSTGETSRPPDNLSANPPNTRQGAWLPVPAEATVAGRSRRRPACAGEDLSDHFAGTHRDRSRETTRHRLTRSLFGGEPVHPADVDPEHAGASRDTRPHHQPGAQPGHRDQPEEPDGEATEPPVPGEHRDR
ncbi:MAG: hypothetical protein ACYCXA_13275, partial [Actinomycetes bacterium]